MQSNSQHYMNRSCTTLNMRALDKLIPISPPLPLPKIGEVEAKMHNKLFSSINICQTFFSVRLTKKLQAYLCSHGLLDSFVKTFSRLVMGMRLSPFVATKALNMVSNQLHFEIFMEEFVQDESIKSILKKLKLQNYFIFYIDDLLLFAPKVLGVEIYLYFFKFILFMNK